MDLFATRLNTKLPLYVSPIPDPQAWAVDALNIPWENLVAYAYPPTIVTIVQALPGPPRFPDFPLEDGVLVPTKNEEEL